MSAGVGRVALGEWYEAAPQTVTGESMAVFAAAVGETDPELLAGRAMPPTFPVVAAWRAQNRVLDGVLPDDLLGLHGEQGFVYHRPLAPGARTTARSAVVEIRSRRTGSTVTTVTEIADERGPVCSARFTIFVVGGALVPFGPPTTDATVPTGLPVLATVTERMDEDQPERYAAASGDTYRIHLDDGAAHELGLPGRIIHGMCTLAFAARAVRDTAAARGQNRLRELSARFSSPVFPGAEVTTTVRGAERGGSLVCGFETESGGAVAITRGQAVVVAA